MRFVGMDWVKKLFPFFLIMPTAAHLVITWYYVIGVSSKCEASKWVNKF